MNRPLDPSDIVAWARSYPFGHPGESYLFRNGEKHALEAPVKAVRGRVPVIASGSNAAPAQLARKYAAFARGAEIPVTRAHVTDFDSVYNAHITAYGSVSATLFPSTGTVLETFITWLDEHELEVMHGTEQPGVNYHFTELGGMRMEVEGIGALDAAFAYISVAGCLSHDGGPVSLAEVPARKRRYPALSQGEMQEMVRDRTAPGAELDPFIRENVENHSLRLERSALLAGDSHAFDHPVMRVIEVRTA
ncbi:MAG TPA: hypothetical protein VLN73_00975 [Alphaproteobacteria bacterium]|nr:hypothetical protein [Alphaproteobacteria bacterium]